MRRRVLACVAAGGVASAGSVLLACSLAVSTTGFSGGAEPSPEGGDASVVDAAAGLDSATIDAALDSGGDPSLLAEYSFEDPIGSFSVRDTSGNDKNGVTTNDATFTNDGHRGHALQVLGTGTVVVAGLSGGAFPRSGTLSLWFRYSAQSATVSRGIFDNYDTGRSHLFIRHPNGSPADQFQIALQSELSGGQYATATEFAVPESTWTHLVASWDEAKREGVLYLDGALFGSATYDLPFAPDMQSFILGGGLVGAIDEVRLWSRVLSAAEATKLD